MILVIDNYDSFTFNLVHYLQELGAEVRVERNDALTAREAVGSGAKGILLSPGPRTPNEAGITLDTVAACADAGLPLLGVCLGHQFFSVRYVLPISLTCRTALARSGAPPSDYS